MNPSEQDPFRVEDEPEGDWQPPPGAPPPPPPRPKRVDEEGTNGFHVVPLDTPPTPTPARVVPHRPLPEPDEETGVDTRTVAERRGKAVPAVAGRRPPPPGWPGEAFSFPLRSPGPQTIAGATALLVLLDLASRANFFFGLLLKLIAAILFLRWQLRVASTTAGGHDEPAGWAGAMEMSRESIRGIGLLLVAAVVLVAPGIVADVLERSGLAVVLFVAGSLLLAAVALGQVVGDPTLLRPWNALAWIVRHPLGLLAATVGWWAAGWTEILVWWMRDASTGLYVAAALGLRLAGMYLWLLSARFLGVVGRSWSLFADGDAPEPTSAAGS